MPRPKDRNAAREKAFNDLPQAARMDIAQARNMRARMLTKREEYLAESRKFKAMVHRLNRVHKLTTNKIALLMDLTWKWVDTIVSKGTR